MGFSFGLEKELRLFSNPFCEKLVRVVKERRKGRRGFNVEMC
jgi:hypothetical protein